MAAIKCVIGDTSAIVAAIKRNEQHHEWARTKFKELPQPIITCEAVVSECLFLLKPRPDVQQDLLTLVASGVIKIDFSLSDDIERVIELTKKYENVPMSLADACLVRISEIKPESAVFTLDSDFSVYRKNRMIQIPLIMPK